VRVKHHLCHAASAFLISPYDQAATLTVDGSGEIASTTLGVGQGSRIRIFKEIHFPHSLGYLYVALTHYLGFTPDSDEYKVMALASFGEPRYYEAFKKIIRLKPGGGYEFDLSYFNYQRGIRMPWVSEKFVRAFGPRRRRGAELTRHHYDIAWALQKRLEDAVLHLAGHLHDRTGLRNLCFAGGTALNCRLNQALLRESPFENVFVQPAANDAGTGIGSAFYIWHGLGRPRDFVLEDMYLGPGYSRTQCRMALDDANLSAEELAEDQLIERTADLLEKGKVVAWFQGRMEMGPRALGNRSILADPRRAEMKDVINSKVKHRESFRPFAPAVLEEAAAEYFQGAIASPYMLFVFPVRPEKIDVIPAVAHVDGTARIQTVTRGANPRFFELLKAFERKTGVPVLLNTSFNVMGEPIVCTPQEAITCYRSTQIDALVLNDFLLVKPGAGQGPARPEIT
jgi:carbamoyltransferase